MRHALVVVLAVVLAGLVGCGPVSFTVGSKPDYGELDESIVHADPAAGFDKIAMIDVSGLIRNSRSRGLLSEDENPVARLHEQLRAAGEDASVRAVILRLNTPGGTVTASDAMYREVMRFKDRTDKPVVALMMDVAASGGYYLACAADRIVAHPTSVTGSIGVIIQTFSVRPAMDRLGVRAEAFTSGDNKAAGSPFETMTDEQRRVFRAMIDDFYGRFVEVVKTNRPNIPADRFDEVTDGRVVTGEDAVTLGLVDQTGDWFDAFIAAKALAGIDEARLIRYHRPNEYAGSIYAQAPTSPGDRHGGGTQINVAQFNLDEGTMGDPTQAFLYLWMPGR